MAYSALCRDRRPKGRVLDGRSQRQAFRGHTSDPKAEGTATAVLLNLRVKLQLGRPFSCYPVLLLMKRAFHQEDTFALRWEGGPWCLVHKGPQHPQILPDSMLLQVLWHCCPRERGVRSLRPPDFFTGEPLAPGTLRGHFHPMSPGQQAASH